ncbi:protein kinase domain-containing protein [Ditylenchus destructor]|uniref:Protein kinase domain-containing protein n=1 Tax=Ditylenchus destructor TaxID=166010 RepID=A0AAD4QZY8_9BILA|nr:protein kinase domain-containing protein [Ditylenchus destructor]
MAPKGATRGKTAESIDTEDPEQKVPEQILTQPSLDREYFLLQEKNRVGHDVAYHIDKSRPQYVLFGKDIPRLCKEYAKKLQENKISFTFDADEVVKGNKFSFKVIKKMRRGSNCYIVMNTEDKNFYYMKVEPHKAVPREARLDNEVRMLMNSKRAEKQFREHFLKIHDVGKGHRKSEQYNMIATELAGFNLPMLHQHYGFQEFRPADAIRLCMQTLQAIHDVHLCHYIHRDVRPKNFVIGSKRREMVYIVNFGLSFEYYPDPHNRCVLAKHKNLSPKFQPRAFHTGSEYTRLGDMESWLYVCFWLFDRKCLPWNSLAESEKPDERQICNCKELFFAGLYDQKLATNSNLPLGPLIAMRNQLKTDLLHATIRTSVDYSFYGRTVLQMMEVMPKFQWNDLYQWQTPDALEYQRYLEAKQKSLSIQLQKSKKSK